MNWSRQAPSPPQPPAGRTELTAGRQGLHDGPEPWHPGIWHGLEALQQPNWTSTGISQVRRLLRSLPPLTTREDVRALAVSLAEVQAGKAFVLQAGDCAEPFGTAAVEGAAAKDHLLGRLSTLISDHIGLPVVTIGRLAGQFGKPRSQPTELVEGRVLPSFRGLIVNGPSPTEAERRHFAPRLIDAYRTAQEVFAELERLARDFGPGDPAEFPPWWSSPPPRLSIVDSSGSGHRPGSVRVHNRLWASHEALVLDYEEPLTRRDPDTGDWYLSSTHLPWIGARTNQPDGAHAMFLAGVANPIACKVGLDVGTQDLLRLCARLDPHHTPGRLTLIVRHGAALIRDRLPALVAAVREAGHPVIWMCDPMHGNTVKAPSGLKTRYYDDILDEVQGFFAVMAEQSQWPGGVHLEVAADDVTECVGGGGPGLADLPSRYRSLCDPRLNDVQALALVREIADLLFAAAASPSDATGLLAANCLGD
ncbi:3-deoxy-7-phosphoheptulonate synthase [Amycolatopsis taiwanensis]|uniref:Phospho-2-dehydro-3-deoxyheptonate aldolase n=1 Tax=Amycolatopsis taiwanensis TaxID=342230 RepID=A0A9W6RAL4_9PSEU|nr:3-deoxy-7-phosphoheptulonate synthase [Amycolatopsis taiwanensis]GLY70572.1 phospho-2-dehydro-3-deoxyheptonate aldolase [Amycolatopsis taiwanensis]